MGRPHFLQKLIMNYFTVALLFIVKVTGFTDLDEDSVVGGDFDVTDKEVK